MNVVTIHAHAATLTRVRLEQRGEWKQRFGRYKEGSTAWICNYCGNSLVNDKTFDWHLRKYHFAEFAKKEFQEAFTVDMYPETNVSNPDVDEAFSSYAVAVQPSRDVLEAQYVAKAMDCFKCFLQMHKKWLPEAGADISTTDNKFITSFNPIDFWKELVERASVVVVTVGVAAAAPRAWNKTFVNCVHRALTVQIHSIDA